MADNKITKDDVRKLGALARIKIDEKEIKLLQKDMENILGFVSKLSTQSLANTKVGLLECEAFGGKTTNILREDENPHESGKHTEDLLNQAPELKEGFVKVKKVL